MSIFSGKLKYGPKGWYVEYKNQQYYVHIADMEWISEFLRENIETIVEFKIMRKFAGREYGTDFWNEYAKIIVK